MKLSFKTALPFVLLLLVAVAFLSAEASSPVPASYSTQVSVEPISTAGFSLKAQVKDNATGQVVAGAMLKLPSGEAGDTETTLETGEKVTLSATIDGTSKTADYKVSVKRGETLLSEHSAKLAL